MLALALGLAVLIGLFLARFFDRNALLDAVFVDLPLDLCVGWKFHNALESFSVRESVSGTFLTKNQAIEQVLT